MKTKTTTAGKTAKILCMFALACGLLFTNCAKKGDTGPAGPAGTNGTNGNANVKSKTIFVAGSEWINSAGASTVTKLVSEITTDIINNGAVLVYVDNGSNNWSALPVTTTDPSGVVLAFGYDIEPGKLILNAEVNQNVTLTASTFGNTNFRIVTIAGSGRMANPNLNYNDYNEVKKAFNLKD